MPKLNLSTATDQVVLTLRAHLAYNVAADVAEATTRPQLEAIGRAASEFTAITDTHVALIGLLAAATGASSQEERDVYLTGLRAVLDGPLTTWIVTTDAGQRTWQATNAAHALQQHEDLDTGETLRSVRRGDTPTSRIDHAAVHTLLNDGTITPVSDELTPGHDARQLIDTCLTERALLIPDGFTATVEGEDDEDGSYLRVIVSRDGWIGAERSQGWASVKNVQNFEDGLSDLEQILYALTWASREIDLLVAEYATAIA